MRRASSPTEVVFSPSYHYLLSQLQQQDFKIRRDALAAVAGLAAHIKEDTGQEMTFARQMASPKSQGSGAKVSGLRFRRLLAVSRREELYPLLIRVIRLLDGRVNLSNLANAVYWWNERTRRQWAYDYYASAPEEK
jgi:CRISPR system Cascade subunit CasB